jgi:CopG family nickel-responsive transcriptional regulator
MAVVRFGVSLPRELVKAFDKRLREKGYRSRSEAIRDIMRDYLVGGEWESSSEFVVGTVTLVFDHHTRELSNVLTQVQHEFHDAVVCSTHVHLDEHNCVEVIIVRGRAKALQAIADRLISTRGVKHGKLVYTTTGRELA